MTAPRGRVTPSQTVGPFFENALLRDPLNVLAGDGARGERIRVEGRVLDGDGAPVPDALVEIWQANAHGRYRHPSDGRDLPLDTAFAGFGRAGTDDEGHFWFETIKPGPVPFAEGVAQAPHLCVTVFARGLLNHLSTRLYFADDPRTAADPILERVPPARRRTLLARRDDAGGAPVYRWDVVLQGDAETETVFFARR
jgi:protocatechuate 3,4-dioxygenase alpha subunit